MKIELRHLQLSKPAKSLVSTAGIFSNRFLDFRVFVFVDFWILGFLTKRRHTPLKAWSSCVWEPPAVRISHQKPPPPL